MSHNVCSPAHGAHVHFTILPLLFILARPLFLCTCRLSLHFFRHRLPLSLATHRCLSPSSQREGRVVHEVAGGAGWPTVLVASSPLPPLVAASLSLPPRLVGRLDLVGCCVVPRLSLLHCLQLVHYLATSGQGLKGKIHMRSRDHKRLSHGIVQHGA